MVFFTVISSGLHYDLAVFFCLKQTGNVIGYLVDSLSEWKMEIPTLQRCSLEWQEAGYSKRHIRPNHKMAFLPFCPTYF